MTTYFQFPFDPCCGRPHRYCSGVCSQVRLLAGLTGWGAFPTDALGQATCVCFIMSAAHQPTGVPSVGRDCHTWPSCTCALLMLIMAACAWFVCVTTGPESVFTSPPVLGSGCVHMMHACRCLGSCHGKYSTSVAFSDVVYVHHVSSMCCVYIGCWLQLSLWLLDVHISA